ncbi:MAG: hypothetical protein SNJ68_09345 [Cyanobacteriota bacterium]
MKFPPATPRNPLRKPRGSAPHLSLRSKRQRLGGSLDLLGNWLLWGGMGLLLGQRLRSISQPAHLQWWRVFPVSGSEGSLYSGQTELPLFQWMAGGFLPWLAQGTGIPIEAVLRGVSVLACLVILILCWNWGNFWSAGLWGLSPWVLTQGLEPGSEILGSLVLLCSCGMGSSFRWGGLALACALTPKVWPLVLLLTGLWISQQWPRQRWRGAGLILLVMGLSWLGRTDWLSVVTVSTLPTHRLSYSSGLAVLATLMLPLGLTLVRLGWPWSERQHTLISLASLGHVLWMGVLALLVWGPQVNGLQQSARWGLVVLPLLCLSAGGVLAEIPHPTWRRLLGSLLLSSSFLLSWQALT